MCLTFVPNNHQGERKNEMETIANEMHQRHWCLEMSESRLYGWNYWSDYSTNKHISEL